MSERSESVRERWKKSKYTNYIIINVKKRKI